MSSTYWVAIPTGASTKNGTKKRCTGHSNQNLQNSTCFMHLNLNNNFLKDRVHKFLNGISGTSSNWGGHPVLYTMKEDSKKCDVGRIKERLYKFLRLIPQ